MGLSRCGKFFFLVVTLGVSSTVNGKNNAGLRRDQRNSSTDFPKVTTPQGMIRGLYLETRNEREIFGFKGIPYAKPPVGDLRFRNPLPADYWDGTFDASRESDVCPQFWNQIIVGDEDCLYLNVYTPKLPDGEFPPLIPVMMFVHGGGFAQGSNDFNTHGPGYLLDRDVVLVVPNYRLGVLGFLSTGDKYSPGNYGLKDQVLALKWIRDNIISFGGDPDQVTIVGHDAGGISANYLALSDTAKGLFHRYIAQSGPALGFGAYQPKVYAAENAMKLSQHFGCPTNTSVDAVACLRTLDTTRILDTESLFHAWDTFPLIVWGPTDEPVDDEAILTDSPAKLLAKGKLHDVPCITGVVKDEGLLMSTYFYSNPDKFEHLLANMNDVLPHVLQYYRKIADVTAYTAAFKQFYLDDLTIERSILMSNFTDLVGDALIIYPTYEQLRWKISSRKSPSYYYSFEYRGTISYTDLQIKSMKNFGVSHGDELIYLFPRVESEFKSTGKVMTSVDLQMVNVMVDLWSSFVYNGIPVSIAVNDAEAWEPYSTRYNYLRLGKMAELSFEFRQSFNKGRMKLWRELTTRHSSIVFGNIGNRSKHGTNKARRPKRSVEDDARLKISQGTVKGIKMTIFPEKNISAFLGVPYAQPPVGNLRFKDPVAADSWSGILDATADDKVCPQIFENRVIGNEDCLYLNVYTPQNSTGDGESLPVMVYIHGGGFETGNAGPSYFSPEYLLDKDVVLVAPNYRLGVLGFLSTGDNVIPGNYGLKDIVMALRWVKDNIVYFGGDPSRVTVFGQGAGAGAVELLALSNSTDGLFHRCITQSGSAFSIRSFRPVRSYVSRATELGRYVGCPAESSSLAKCLRRLNFSAIVNTRSSFYAWDSFPDTVWGPTSEPDGMAAFITENPTSIYATGRSKDLPWITGVVRNEGLLLTSKFYANPKLFEEFLKKIDTVLPHVLQYRNVVNDERTDALMKYYLNDLTADRSVLLTNFTNLVGDSMFTFPLYDGLRKRLPFRKNLAYFYSFEYRGTSSFSYTYSGGSMENYGVAHGDELLYLFPQLEPTLTDLGEKMSKNDKKMVEFMVELWTSFAANGTPNAKKLKGFKKWRPHSVEDNYLQIGEKENAVIRPHYFFLSDRMSFWQKFNDTMSEPHSSLLDDIWSVPRDVIAWIKNIASSIYDWAAFW